MNSSDSDSSSAASPSPPTSPQQTSTYRDEPSLERLVLHFVAAKKSLTATQHVYRATELATSSRALIEEIAALNAKNSYARRGVDEQVETLREIRAAVADAGEHAGDEFTQTIASLDVANDRLQSTLASLRKVIIDRSLQKPKAVVEEEEDQYQSQYLTRESSSSHENENATKQKTLYDFVDEANHEDLLASLRTLIDTFNDSRADLDDNISRFDDSIARVVSALQGEDGETDDSNPPSKITPYDEPPLSIPALFHDMESHAAEMATLLQSLISHYDLCVSALKHTEGGGEAAREAVQAADELAKNAQGVEESLYAAATVPDPMDAAERAEMLRVLENDAAEVEDVVGELRERGSEIEGLYGQLCSRAENSRKTMRGLRRAVESMHAVRDALPVYLDAVAGFREGWSNLRASMQGKTQELVGLCGFYEQFWSGYKKLLREVDRRAAVEAQMVKVAEKARQDLEKLYEADREAREEFVDEVGGFLPGDIWPGLAERGSRWEVREIGDGEDEEELGGRRLMEG
jgi:autophagy-related protein 17